MKYSCSRQQDLHQRQHRHRLLVVPRLWLVRSPSAVWFVLCTRPFVLICCSLCRDGVLGTLRKRSQYAWYAATSTRCRRFSKQYVHLLLHSYLLTSVKCNSFLCVGRDLNCMTLRGSGEWGIWTSSITSRSWIATGARQQQIFQPPVTPQWKWCVYSSIFASACMHFWFIFLITFVLCDHGGCIQQRWRREHLLMQH